MLKFQKPKNIGSLNLNFTGSYKKEKVYTWSIKNLRYTCLGWVDLLYPVSSAKNNQVDYLPATYCPYMTNFKLYLDFRE